MSSISSWLSAPPNNFSTTLSSGVTNNALTIPLNSVTGLPTEGVGVIFKKDADGAVDATTVEFIHWTNVSGLSLTLTDTGDRGIDGSYGAAAQAHDANDYFEVWVSSQYYSSQRTGFVAEHSAEGVHSEAALDSMITGTEAQGDIIYHNGTIWTRLPIGSTGQALTVTAGSPAWGSVASFWGDVPGTPTRVSDTQFTITDTSNANGYDTLFKKGVVLKWLESSTFQTAMVISSSYGTNTVTINIVGDSLTAGFTSMKYAIQEAMCETFIIPGTIATGTDLAKTWYVPEQCYIISADAYVKTAGTTNSTVFDINDDGSTKFTTKPTITTGTTSDIDNVADNPSTAVAKDSLITIDVDSVSTTAPVEAYVKVFWYPIEWTKR